MAKRSMNEKLKNLKQEQEDAKLPAEQKIVATDGDDRAGTPVSINEEIEISPEDRPKPLPKKNRRGSKQMQQELEAAKEAEEADDGIVEYDKLIINIKNYEMIVDGVAVDTPPKELELIYHLASNPNRVFTRDQLLDQVWGFEYYGNSRTVDVHIKRLREKLEGVSDKWELRTIWSVGYKFETK